MRRSFAIFVSLCALMVQSPSQAQELERENLVSIMDVLDEVERSWNDQDVQELTVMAAEPFSLITPDGVYRSLYFRPGVGELLSSYFSSYAGGKLELEFSGLSMLNDTTAYLQATGALGEEDIVITALLRKFGDSWKASNVHISDLSEKRLTRDE